MTADEIIARLGLQPHPEGGHYRQTYRAPDEPLELSLSDDGRRVHHLRLGTDFELGELPQAVVPRAVWQAARSLGNWTLLGCTVAPAFRFENFELAPPGWQPG